MLVGDVSLKVTPAILYKKAESLRTHLKQIEEGFSEINMCFERMEDYWIGKAGGEHRKLYEKQKGDVEEVLNRLKKHTEHLQEIAGMKRLAAISAFHLIRVYRADTVKSGWMKMECTYWICIQRMVHLLMEAAL